MTMDDRERTQAGMLEHAHRHPGKKRPARMGRPPIDEEQEEEDLCPRDIRGMVEEYDRIWPGIRELKHGQYATQRRRRGESEVRAPGAPEALPAGPAGAGDGDELVHTPTETAGAEAGPAAGGLLGDV